MPSEPVLAGLLAFGASLVSVPLVRKLAVSRGWVCYEVEEYRIAMDFIERGYAESLSFDRLIRCKRRGVVEDYELSEGTRLGLELEVERAHASGEEGELEAEAGEDGEAGLLFGRLRLVKALDCAGKRVGSAGAGPRRLLERAASRPDDAEGWRRLGNVYGYGRLPDLAEAAYRRSLAADPAEIEAHLSLGEIPMAKDALAEAHPHYQAVLRLASRCRLAREQAWDLARHAIDCLKVITLETKLPFLPEEPKRSSPEATRIRVLRREEIEEELDRLADQICGFSRP